MKSGIPQEDHYITRLIPIRLGGFLRAAYPEMKKAGLRDKFHEESENCFREIIIFYDLAIKSPRAAEVALKKLKTGELFSEREPDKLKLSLINVARIARDADVIYQEQGHNFALNMTMLSAHLIHIAKEAIEQKLQQEQNPLKSILKQPSTSAERATGKSVSWADLVATDEGRK
jgi:hypothetical protein